MRNFRIGLLLDDKYSSKYVYELAEWAKQQTNLEISHLIIISPHKQAFPRNLYDFINFSTLKKKVADSIFSFIISIESIFLRFSKLHRHHFDKFDLGMMIASQITIRPTLENNAASYQFSEFDVRRVSSLELDLIIRYGSGRLEGDILHAARLGVISYNNGSDRWHGQDQACFWECYDKAPKTGFSIQTLADGHSRSKILLSGFFPTYFFFSLNQANMYRKSSPHFHDLLKRIAAHGEFPQANPIYQSSASPFRTPNVRESIIYLFKVIYRLSKKIAYRCSTYQKKWGLTFIQSNWKGVNSCLRSEAIAPNGHFWADPFIHAHNGITYCFVEDYVYKTRLGHIAVLEVSNGAVVHLGDCIKQPFHLSFPFLFQYKGVLYMCPEASASRQIRLYRCVEFPLQWEPSTIIMDDVSAADTMLFEHAGLWWMLTSIDKSGSNDYTSELYLFYADSPLAKDWSAHPGNPICIDSEGGRNAGLIMEDGKIFRLAQRQGYDQYGEGLLMFEITELTKLTYSQCLVSQINPSLTKGQIGTHHLSTTGAVTVFDHVSRAFSP
jgi:hypothetical protein